jgi:aerobic-type carbon monoxide dehydrogenase small subunit (CoxS/CutS family)
MVSQKITLNVNRKIITANVKPQQTLAEFLREELDLIGTKVGCNRGECGSCTVIVDGEAVLSCTILAVQVEGKDVLTVEGLSEGDKLHPLQEVFIEYDAVQCGYCTPGMLMSLIALLARNPHPTENDISNAIDGNSCRCGCFPNIVKATIAASRKIEINKEAKYAKQ